MFHLAGDEYAVVAAEAAIDELSTVIASELASVHFTFEDQTVGVGLNVGYCRPETEVGLSELRNRADEACRVAKGRGIRAAVRWTKELKAEAPESIRLKCAACSATTTLLVRPSQRTAKGLAHCSNCAAPF